MANVQIHAGDWAVKGVPFTQGTFFFPAGGWKVEKIPVTQLASVEVATEDAVKRLGGAAGWGLVGAALLGPVGLLAGLLAGGNAKTVTFVAEFKDGRKMLATVDHKGFRQLRAAVFE